MTNSKLQKGQGLVEMIIALAIIVTGLVAALALTVSNLSGAQEAGTRVIASNLAREGIDVARNIRDTNWLSDAAWDNGLYLGTDYTAIAVFKPATNKWGLDFTPNTLIDERTKLYRQATNEYLQDVQPPGGVATLFSRLLTLDPICFNPITKTETITGNPCGVGEIKTGVRVKSEVAWTEAGRSHKITLEDRLYNWK